MSDTPANHSPLLPASDAARRLARDLLAGARHAALGVTEPETAAPMVTRIALALSPEGLPMTLISELSLHTAALARQPECSLLVGEPGAKGDPLTHPRLTLQATALFVARDSADHPRLRSHYLAERPKAALYADFADFRFVLFIPRAAHLNGGFGKAWQLAPADLGF